MENCHKVRVYDDFPILFDYLKEIKQKRIRHMCLTRFNDIRNYQQLKETSQNNEDCLKMNSVSFTRKIVDIQTKTNRDYCSSTTNEKCFENDDPLTSTNLTTSSTWQKDCFVDQRKKITSSCQNKYRFCKSDGSIYFVDHVNQTVIDRSNLIFCKRINHDNETYPANFDQQRYNCESIYGNNVEKRLNPIKFENATESISNLHQPKINDYDGDDDCNLFSDFIEEEYKLLPNMTKNQTMLTSNNNDENKYIYDDNDGDVYETITNDQIDAEDELQSTKKSINKSRGKNKSMRQIIPMYSDFTSLLWDDFQTPPLSLSIPDWEELCERVYRLERNNNNDHNGGDVMNNQKTWMMKKPKDQEKVFQFSIDNHYPLSVMLDTSSSSVSIDSKDFPKEINLANHDSLNQTTTTANNHQTESLDMKSSEIRTRIITDHDRSFWMENFDLKKFVCQQAERIFNLRKEILTKNNIENLEHWINRLPFADSSEDCLNHSSYPFKLFLFDLCKETIVRLFPMDLIYSIELTLMLPLKMQKRPWPPDIETFVRWVIDNIEQILDLKKVNAQENVCKQNFISSTMNNPLISQTNDNIIVKNSFNVIMQNNQTNIKRFGLMAYCRRQRKLDFVDQLLYQEMLADQPRWSYFEPEIMEIKNSDTLPLVNP